MKTTVILFKSQREWVLATYNGDTIPTMAFKSASAARRFAKWKNWSVRRAANCDD